MVRKHQFDLFQRPLSGGRKLDHAEHKGQKLADFRLTQRSMTTPDCGWRIGRHENRSSTLTENRSSQVRGDSDISSGGEFGMSKA